MNLEINRLIEWLTDDQTPRIERVLAKLTNGEVITISMGKRAEMPITQSEAEIVQAIADGKCRLLESDPTAHKNLPEDEITEKDKQRRDNAWAVIENIVDTPDALINKKERWRRITKARKDHGKSEKVVYALLKRYWQGGQIKNALLPEYKKSQKRKRKFTDKKPGARGKSENAGVPIRPEDEKKFELGIQIFFDKPDKPTLRSAYQKTIARYYNSGYVYENGVAVPQILAAHLVPTERQFRYWHKNHKNPTKSRMAREGKRFNLKYRTIEGSATSMGFGPGSLYQIDSTISDIHLVSALNRAKPIGRPVLYLITDVFSRCIAGFHLTLENASYSAASIALENAIANKIEFCKKYDIDIDERDWPCRGVPETLVADRGELKGCIADPIANSLNIRLDTTPPFRADMKGIVERYFRIGNDRLFHYLPGAVVKDLQRGDNDPRLGARLDLLQLTKLIIHWILDHHRRNLEQYEPDIFAIADGVELTPQALWEWGMINKTGAMRFADPDNVRKHLLPEGLAGITERGIHFKGAFYTCERAIKEQWFVRAREGTSRKVKVRYDPRDVNILYVQVEAAMEKCHLKEISKKFAGKTWADVQAYFYHKGLEARQKKGETLQSEAEYQAQIGAVVIDAKAAFAKPDGPKSERLNNIRANREDQIEALKKKEQASVPPPESDYVGPPSRTELLRRLQEQQEEQ